MIWGIYIVLVSLLFFKYTKYSKLSSPRRRGSIWISKFVDMFHSTSLQVNVNIVIPAKAGIHFLLLMIPLFVLFACDNAGEPIVPEPGDVKMVEHFASDDILAIERGIDAVPESDGIYLAWYSLRDNNISQYNIYRKKESGTFYQRIKTIDLETASPGRDTTFVDDNAEAGLDLNTYYYYFITATNTEGKESAAQDTLKYMLIVKPELVKPDGETYDPDADGLPTLFWNFVDNNPDLYILRIENSFDQVHYIGIFQRKYDDETYPNQSLDLSAISDLPSFTPGVYKWRIDSIGPDEDHSGAESNWKVFIII